MPVGVCDTHCVCICAGHPPTKEAAATHASRPAMCIAAKPVTSRMELGRFWGAGAAAASGSETHRRTSYERLRVHVPGAQPDNPRPHAATADEHAAPAPGGAARAALAAARAAAPAQPPARAAAPATAAAAAPKRELPRRPLAAAAAARRSVGLGGAPPPAAAAGRASPPRLAGAAAPAAGEVDMAGARAELEELTQQVQAQLTAQQLLQRERFQLLEESAALHSPSIAAAAAAAAHAQAPPLHVQRAGGGVGVGGGGSGGGGFGSGGGSLGSGGLATMAAPEWRRPPPAAAASPAPAAPAAAAQEWRRPPPAAAAPPPARPDESWGAARLLAECERLQGAIAAERGAPGAARARERELEDMLLRLERHFKSETAAREAAQHAAAAAGAAEAEARGALDGAARQREEELAALRIERETERQALDEMRHQFDLEVLQARAEVANAQESVMGTEERVRGAEALERARLEADCGARLAAMAAEGERREREQAHHMAIIQQAREMLRWRQQAHSAVAAVIEAKDELMARRRELGATNERMESLVDKLYAGRDCGVDLQGAIGAYYRIAGAAAMGGGGGGALPPLAALPPLPGPGGGGGGEGVVGARAGGRGGTGKLLPAPTGGGGGGGGARQGAQPRGSPTPGGGARLPSMRYSSAAGGAGAGAGRGPPPSAVVTELSNYGRGGGGGGGGGGGPGPQHAAKAQTGSSSYARLHAPGGGGGGSGAGALPGVPSRVFAAPAAYSASAGTAAKRRAEQRARASGGAPDRFADAAKTAAMVTASARWQ
ncbi:MAG: hypothetical protein J3K34DRAFT_508358 [Monoraphidium minutum]|nr:MAG: hypothetical protein J3K34DRAFT_508358 [Monoraphidium minutum]